MNNMRNPAMPRLNPSTVRVCNRSRGSFAIEFSLVLLMFLALFFGILEVLRGLYMWNTLQEVTRVAARYAAVSDFSDPTVMEQLRRNAVFDAVNGRLPFGSPITHENVIIDYMSLKNSVMSRQRIASSSLPKCPARNRLICTGDMASDSCIRFVRVRICQPRTDCIAVPYDPIIPLRIFTKLSIPLPTLPVAETIAKAQSLGYTHGMELCN